MHRKKVAPQTTLYRLWGNPIIQWFFPLREGFFLLGVLLSHGLRVSPSKITLTRRDARCRMLSSLKSYFRLGHNALDHVMISASLILPKEKFHQGISIPVLFILKHRHVDRIKIRILILEVLHNLVGGPSLFYAWPLFSPPHLR